MKNTRANIFIFYTTLFLLIMSTTNGLSSSIYSAYPSTDPEELKKFISLPYKISHAKWEYFGTPEWGGIIPSPTDFATILASADIEEINKESEDTEVNIHPPPNSIRDWLNPIERKIVHALMNKTDLPKNINCKPKLFFSPLAEEKVFGYECFFDEKVLIVAFMQYY